jgi:hypothetical protein
VPAWYQATFVSIAVAGWLFEVIQKDVRATASVESFDFT